MTRIPYEYLLSGGPVDPWPHPKPAGPGAFGGGHRGVPQAPSASDVMNSRLRDAADEAIDRAAAQKGGWNEL